MRPLVAAAPPPSQMTSLSSDLPQTVIAKVSRRLIPFLLLLFVVCYLDRVNVAFAALQMNRTLRFSGATYGFGVGVFFIGYSLLEIPSNLVLARVGARRWIARIAISWGILSSALALTRGPGTFYVLRFLLGVAEAGYFPGIIYYLSQWFPARQRARAIARFMTATPLAGVIGGPLAGATLVMDGRGGLAGWQWLFLLEGIPSVVLGVAALVYLTDRPDQARWLAKAEREWLVAHLERERITSAERHSQSVRRALTSGTVWRLALLQGLCITYGLYALSFWLPQILKSLSGQSDSLVALMSVAPYVVAVITMVIVGLHSDRTGDRCLHIVGCSLVSALGFLASSYLRAPVAAIAALSIAAAGVFSCMGPFWALPSNFLVDAAAAGGIALINSIANVMGFAVPYALGILKDVTGGYGVGLALLAILPLAGALMAFRLRTTPLLATVPR
jgi:MFS transporter, ACS family, tartrate transporter